MNVLLRAVRVELLKVRRSRMPLFTILGFSLAPFAGGFFMVVLKDPELARRLGMISAKAQIIAGTADWPTYLSIIAQAIAIGGLILFSLVSSWVFGREFVDRTVKDILALPMSRTKIVLAKFIVVIMWSFFLTAIIYVISLGVGSLVGLPPASPYAFWTGTLTVAGTACLTVAVVTPVAFVASAGRGYIPPMGGAILAVVVAQVVAAAGWGEFFPWSIPALYAGTTGPESANLGMSSLLIVMLTGLSGLVATFAWWTLADQKQ